MRVGIADHFGWAVAVTANAHHDVVDRRRIELVEPGTANAPFHHEGKDLGADAFAQLLSDVRASMERATAAALDELAADLPRPVRSISLRVIPANFPTDVDVLRRVPWEARADAVLYRGVLVEAARARGWAVRYYDAKTAEAEAAARLGDRADAVLHGPREALGPPWTKDHRTALAATVLAAAG